MKKIIFLVVLFCSLSFGQGWNSVVSTTINESNLEKMDLFTNKDGNHVLLKRYNGNIVYYNFNSSGTVDNNKTVTLETNGDFPNIVGSNDRVYALYKIGNYIKGKYSTNGGSSWANIPDRSINPYPVNGVDAVYEINRGVHLVWATKDGWNPPFNEGYYETYYYRLSPTHSWVDFKNVTDYTTDEIGGFPTVSFSSNRVHVSYNDSNSDDPETSAGISKTRDKYVSTWQTPQTVFSNGSSRERVQAGSSKLLDFYYKIIVDLGQYHYELFSAERTFSGTSWTNHQQLNDYVGVSNLVNSANTTDGKTHIVYEITGGVGYRNYNGASWSSEFTVGTGYEAPQISSVSNDLFVVWSPNNYPNNYINYRQYDANPLTPANFAGTTYNNHPKVIWIANSEPDLNHYEIWRQFVIDIKNPGSWTLIATSTQTNFVDNDVVIGNGSAGDVIYKIRAKDINNHLSGYTNTISFDFQDLQKQAYSSSDEIKDFSISQNYPNPFNPSTKITYALPEDAIVQIKIYDMLGTEVAELVNDTKPAGYYETTFDASNFSSGVYIYRITALREDRILFSQSKQMIMLK
ncbi:MAG: T9SS type A sorting domain-containing protein [Ignavibacteria bacterium]|nr:T9SS type A sorting domain-containing protein [Ignavibacteria bacterium]